MLVRRSFTLATSCQTVTAAVRSAAAVCNRARIAWNSDGILNLEARHAFSLATCNGSHTSETETEFVHIATREPAASQLSDVLTGANMPKTDPVSDAPDTSTT